MGFSVSLKGSVKGIASAAKKTAKGVSDVWDDTKKPFTKTWNSTEKTLKKTWKKTESWWKKNWVGVTQAGIVCAGAVVTCVPGMQVAGPVVTSAALLALKGYTGKLESSDYEAAATTVASAYLADKPEAQKTVKELGSYLAKAKKLNKEKEFLVEVKKLDGKVSGKVALENALLKVSGKPQEKVAAAVAKTPPKQPLKGLQAKQGFPGVIGEGYIVESDGTFHHGVVTSDISEAELIFENSVAVIVGENKPRGKGKYALV